MNIPPYIPTPAAQNGLEPLLNATANVFRRNKVERDALGNPTASQWTTVATGERCAFHNTPNYDVRSSPAGQSKENNIMTSDKVRFRFDLDLRAQDVVYVAYDSGGEGWYTVAGDPKTRQLIPHQYCYLVTTPKPEGL